MSVGFASAQAPAAQVIEAPKPKQTLSPDSAFSEARRLSQQGKFDEAIAQLKALAANQPDLKGLSHELGVVYYKKADYLKAVASFKKALEENPGDNEAVQLMGLSYYLAGRPAEAIAPLEKVQTWFPSANVDASYILGICYIQTKDYPEDVCRARRFRSQLSVYGADVAAAGFWTRCGGIRKKGRGSGSQASAGTFAARRALSLQVPPAGSH
jgi:tetratricopeptide (TPR) repeat protein